MRSPSAALRLTFAYLLLAALPGCDGPTEPPATVAVLKLSADTATLVPGATASLTASPLDALGKPLTRTITWASSDVSVATVTGGLVTAIAPGKVTISATAMAVTSKSEITVKEGAVIGPQGGTFTAAGGVVSVTVPAGAVAAPAQMIVDSVPVTTAVPRLLAGTVFRLESAVLMTMPVSIGLRYNPAKLSAGSLKKGLKIYSLTGDKWVRAAMSVVDTVADRVFASVAGTGTFAIFEQAPAVATVSTGENQTAAAGTAVAVRPSIKIIDVEGFPVPDVAVEFTVSAGGGTVTGASALTNSQGIATVGSWTLGSKAGSNTLSAAVARATGGPFAFTATAVAAAPAKLVFATSPPSTVQSTIPFPVNPGIQVTDEFSNPVLTSGITIAASVTAGSATLGGTRTRTTNTVGIATFNDLVLTGSSGQKALTFTSGNLPPLSAFINVTGGSPSAVQILSGNGQTAVVGNAVPVQPAVRITDVAGAPVAGLAVLFNVASGSGAITGAEAVTDANGVARVGSWTLGTVAGPNTLRAIASGFAENPVVFTATAVAAAPAKLVFATPPPSTVQSTIAFPVNPTVQVTDEFGNPVSGITVAVSITAGSATLGGTRTRATSAFGIASFNDLVLTGSSGQKGLTFTSGNLPPLSALIKVTGGSPAGAQAFAGNGQTAVAGTSVSVQPAVRITDPAGDPVAGVAVIFNVASGNGVIAGGEAVTDANGVARVGSWTVGTVAGANTLRAVASGLTENPVIFTATSVAAAPARLVFATSPPTTVQSTIPFPVNPAVQVTDEFANPVLTSGIAIGATLTAGSATLGGTRVRTTSAAGIATFNDLVLTGNSGQKGLTFTSGNLPPLNAFINVTGGSGAAAEIFAGNGQTAVAGSTVPVRPAVRVTDLAGAPVAGVSVFFNVASGDGLIIGGEAVTDANGVAQVGSWTLGKVAGANTLRAVASGLAENPVLFTATGTIGAPASIVLVSGANQTGPTGRGPPSYALFRVFDASGNGVPDVPVNFSVVAGGGSVTATGTSLSTGIVVVKNWTFGVAAGRQSVRATVASNSALTATVDATAITIRVVTFGDSNTDYGYIGYSSNLSQVSYISANPLRPTPFVPNSFTQVAGKIESFWATQFSAAIVAINHAVLGTSSGSTRSTAGAPGARTVVNGVTRFEGEVLGRGMPWHGGEPTNSSFPGPIARLQAVVPTVNDYVYVSIGTNDGGQLITSAQTIDNLTWMIDTWIAAGLPADHFILTNLPPAPGQTVLEADRNRAIRTLAIARNVKFIDLTRYTSDDEGITWKSPTLHVGDEIHYAESVREWIAQQVVAIIAAATQPAQ